MNRRTFLSSSLITTTIAASVTQVRSNSPSFNLKYAPHPGMFRYSAGEDIFDQIRFSADQGFTAWEDNYAWRRPREIQSKIGETLRRLGMTMGVFIAFADFKTNDFVTRTDIEYQRFIRDEMHKAVEVAKRLNATWTTVIPNSVNQKLDPEFQRSNCIANLRAMAEVCEPTGLVMVLEPLNWYANHPGLFLRSVPQAYAICRSVDSPSCKILNDLYHQQVDVGNLIPNLELAWDETAYYQVGDNPGRKEPTTGEINYKNIFRLLHHRGFDGVIGMEHGNSRPGRGGEQAVIAAYREVDRF